MVLKIKRRFFFITFSSFLFVVLIYSVDDPWRRLSTRIHQNHHGTNSLQFNVHDKQPITEKNIREMEKKTTRETTKKKSDAVTRMEKRSEVVSRACANNLKRHPNMTIQRPNVQDVLFNPKYGFYYCPIEKVASTFWRRFTYQLNHTSPVRSPFDVGIMQALQSTRHFHLPLKQRFGKELEHIIGSSTKLLFVRDPHSRIFSAYVDKLLAPNPYYWKTWAMPAIVRYRQKHHKVQGHAHCGHDVTFPEFVSYVLDIASTKDGHVMPINSMCAPCAVPYTVIGKMETFTEDAKMLFDLLHLDSTILRIDTMKKETAFDAIADSATDALSGGWLLSTMRCISKEAVLQRIWRKNQIRGFISWRRNMELSSKEIKFMNSRTFIQILQNANKLSDDDDELKLQKTQAKKEAFFMLSEHQLKEIEKVYSEDLELFDYEAFPSWLKELHEKPLINTNAFDYSRPWDLSRLPATLN